MVVAVLQIGDDGKHFTGTTSQDIPKGTPIIVRRIEGTKRYQMTEVGIRSIGSDPRDLQAFLLPEWILNGLDEPPPKQQELPLEEAKKPRKRSNEGALRKAVKKNCR